MRWALALLVVLAAAAGGFAGGYALRESEELRDGRGRVVEPTTVDVRELRVGDCLSGVEGGESVAVQAVPCKAPHQGQVRSQVQLPDGEWPGRKRLLGAAGRRCAESFFFVPSQGSWGQDDRVVTCIAR